MSTKFDDYLTILSSVQTYLHLEYSVIPLRGTSDLANPKVPSIRWKTHQTNRATETDLQMWLADDLLGGIGIVTGHISRLAVLDFDELRLFEQFEATFPTLCGTRQVETRRGRHLHFHIPSHIATKTTKTKGVDWLYDGAYVVAPPSIINGHRYKLCRGGMPRTLTQSEVQQIAAFLQSVGHIETQTEKSEKDSIPVSIDVNQHQPVPDLNADSLIRIYQSLSHQKKSRNEGLFYAALHARDCGWSSQQTIACLRQFHLEAKSFHQHAPETLAQRLAEVHRTIQSAFSRPPANSTQNLNRGLPNTLREKLLAHKQTALLRVLEGLVQSGYVGGEVITRRDMASVLNVQPDYRVIREALGAKTPDETPVFQRCFPSPRPPSLANAANDCTNVPRTKCFVREQKRSEKRGRPMTSYQMPSIYALCDWYDVLFSASDVLSEEALKSTSVYRQAVHTSFIKRRPGQYSRSFLAKRLSVSMRTLDKYNRCLHINKQTMYDSQPIFWSNLNQLPFDLMLGGHCIKDKDGRSYPLVKAIAVKFLTQGKPIWYVRQTVNHYSCTGQLPNKQMVETQKEDNLDVKAYFETLYQSRPILKHPTKRDKAQNQSLQLATNRPPTLKKLPIGCEKSYRRILDSTQAEHHARQIQHHMNQMVDDKSQKLSLRKARQLVDKRGVRSVQTALNRVQKRDNVRNPVGLLITMLRC